MRKFTSVALTLLFSAGISAFAQTAANFRVVRVVGNVESAKLKRLVRTEDIIPEDDQLKFQHAQDYLIVFHPKQGRKRIQGIPDSQPREFNLLLQSFVKPDEKSTGTRGSGEAYIDQLKESLVDSVLILGDGAVALDPAQLSLKAPATIKAEYKTRDKKNVVLTISSGQSLHLDKKTLFPEGQIPATKIIVMYFKTDSSNPLDADEFLGNFSPKYVDDQILLPEVRAIVESLKGRVPKEIELEVFKYLSQEYGKPQPMQLQAWLKAKGLLPES